MENLYENFRRCFPSDRARPFIELEGGSVFSYADLERTSARYCRLWEELGVKKGDRIAVQIEKSPQAVFLYLSCLRSSTVFLPLNTAYKAEELEYFFSDAEPTVVVCDPCQEGAIGGLAKRCGVVNVFTLAADGSGTLMERSADLNPDFPTVETNAKDLAAILYTSGTTGRSKGAMLTHRNLLSNAEVLHTAWGWVPEDTMLHALPIFHTHGLFVAINCVLLNGSKMFFLPRFEAEAVIRLLPRSTVFMGVPTHYSRLLSSPNLTKERCRNMRLFISGSAPLLKETFDTFRERTGHIILERYGMTETNMNTSNPLHGERIPGTVGFPLPGVEARVANDEGEIIDANNVGILEVKGPNVSRGYWRMPEKTKETFREDGFFITGDIARIDDRGYVHIIGRANDMIITGGLNVYPKEVEAVIGEMDGITESAVIGIPHPDFGEAVIAVVKLQKEKERNGVSEEAIISSLKKRLANFKVPKRVHFVDELPRNAMGKVQKNVLRERYEEKFASAI